MGRLAADTPGACPPSLLLSGGEQVVGCVSRFTRADWGRMGNKETAKTAIASEGQYAIKLGCEITWSLTNSTELKVV